MSLRLTTVWRAGPRVRTALFGLLVSFCVTPLRAQVDVLYIHGTHPPALAGETLRLNDTGGLGFSRFRLALEAVGFTLEEFEAGPGSTSQLTETLLANYKVIILSSNNRIFSAAEATAVSDWVASGGGVIAWSDAAFGRDQDGAGGADPDSAANNTGIPNTIGLDSDNSLTVQFGMQFLRDSANGVYDAGVEAADYQLDHFLWKNDPVDGLVHFVGEGVSPIKVSAPAQVLLRYTDTVRNDGSQPPSLSSADIADGIVLNNTIAALAIAEVGQGRVIGTFDRNTFFNPPGAGTNIDQHDNELFAQNLVLWAAHADPDSLTAIGDYNRNRTVDTADYVAWRNTLNQTGPDLAADGNGDDIIDNDDYNVWRSDFGQTLVGAASRAASTHSVGAPPPRLGEPTAAVPEPSTAIVLLTGAAILIRRQRQSDRSRRGPPANCRLSLHSSGRGFRLPALRAGCSFALFGEESPCGHYFFSIEVRMGYSGTLHDTPGHIRQRRDS